MENSYAEGNSQNSPMTLGSWLITLIIWCIPCVGFIMLFVWGFGNGNENRKTFARAALILTAIGIVLTFLLYAIMGVGFLAALASI